MKTLDTTEVLYSPGKAREVVRALNDGDLDGWTYQVVDDPAGEGFSRIAVYDETGEFVAWNTL